MKSGLLVQFRLLGQTGRRYAFEVGTNLFDPGWQRLATNTAVNGTLHFEDPKPLNPNEEGRYYRAVILP